MASRRGLVFRCACALALVLPLPAAAFSTGPFVETQTLRITDPGPVDDLGYSIGVGGGLMIAGAINVEDAVGNDVGAAYVYRKDANDQWIEDGLLKPGDGQHNDTFGRAVDIYGQTAIMGVPRHDALGDSSGAAYIYANRSPEGWQQLTKLIPEDGDRSELFGLAVGMSEKVAAVGAFRHDDDPRAGTRREKGAVYVYEEDDLQNWTSSTKLQPNDLVFGDHFGFRLDVFGDTLVATAPSAQHLNNNWNGAAYIYRKNGASWSQMAKVTANDPMGSGTFGIDVSLGAGRLIVGALGAPNTDSRGGAYIFEENNLGQWVQTAELIPHDIDQRWFFGAHVNLSGDMATVVASSSPFGAIDRVVYVFQQDGLGNWHEVATLTSNEAQHSFGFSLASYDGQVFVGSEINAPGAVHVFSQVPEPILALIDIKPGSIPNSVNLKSEGVIPVAILSTDEFDVNDVDFDTLLFGDPLLIDNGGTAVSPLRSALEDVSGDGLLDLTLKFSTADLVENEALGPDTIEGLLAGELLDGTRFEGMDSIRIVPPNGRNGNSLQVSTVPEPTTLALTALGLLGIVWRRRKRA